MRVTPSGNTWRHVGMSFAALACWLTIGLIALELLWATQTDPGHVETTLRAVFSALGMAAVVSLVAVATPTLLTGRSNSVRDLFLGVAVILLITALSNPVRMEAGLVAIIGDMVLTAPFAVVVMVAAVVTVRAWKRRRPGVSAAPQ